MLKVGFSESTMFKEVRPLWGQFKSLTRFERGIRQCRAGNARRPLWGQKIRANESRGQTCLDYAKCSRIWRNSENSPAIFTGDKTMLALAKQAA